MKKKIILENGEYAELLHFVVISNILHAVVKTEYNRIDVVHYKDITFPEMENKGKLCSKIGNKHFDKDKTADDWDCLEKSLEVCKRKLQVAEKALNDILIWQEDIDGDWDYPETIASNALEKLAKIDDF